MHASQSVKTTFQTTCVFVSEHLLNHITYIGTTRVACHSSYYLLIHLIKRVQKKTNSKINLPMHFGFRLHQDNNNNTMTSYTITIFGVNVNDVTFGVQNNDVTFWCINNSKCKILALKPII